MSVCVREGGASKSVVVGRCQKGQRITKDYVLDAVTGLPPAALPEESPSSTLNYGGLKCGATALM